jgi:hypothetical protein
MLERYLLLTSFLALNLACATPRAGPIPWPGQKVPRGASTLAFVHRGGDLCSRTITVNKIEYNFDTACGANVILYVQTSDKKFISPEGLAVGRTLREAVNAGGTVLEEGEDCGVTLPSGWIARPRLGRTTQGQTVTPCSEILDDAIAYFDTELVEPHT